MSTDQLHPDGTLCVCGHPVEHHDAEQCWTRPDGSECWTDHGGNCACPTGWQVAR